MIIMWFQRTAFVAVVVSILIPVFVVSFNTEWDEKRKDCIEKCGGNVVIYAAARDGQIRCFYPPKGLLASIYFNTACVIDCLGEKPASNQTECNVKLCLDTDLSGFELFCTEPDEHHIKKEECVSLVGSGKAKLYPFHCARS